MISEYILFAKSDQDKNTFFENISETSGKVFKWTKKYGWEKKMICAKFG